jgi:hypothetical protein
MVVEIGSLTLMEKHRMRMFENRMLRRILELERNKVTGGGEIFTQRSCVICRPTIQQTILI